MPKWRPRKPSLKKGRARRSQRTRKGGGSSRSAGGYGSSSRKGGPAIDVDPQRFPCRSEDPLAPGAAFSAAIPVAHIDKILGVAPYVARECIAFLSNPPAAEGIVHAAPTFSHGEFDVRAREASLASVTEGIFRLSAQQGDIEVCFD
jgi:hypothetical protein